jgi:hypothetical protein
VEHRLSSLSDKEKQQNSKGYMKWLKTFLRKIKGDDCYVPPLDVPLKDEPGKLLATRLKYHSSGKIEMVESRVNLKEWKRLKRIIMRKNEPIKDKQQ